MAVPYENTFQDIPYTIYRACKHRAHKAEITNYATYKLNPKNPTGFDQVKRVDIKGGAHANTLTKEKVSTPHVYAKNIPGGVRPAKSKEIPKR